VNPTDVHDKGLSSSSVGMLGSVTLGVASVAPAYALTATPRCSPHESALG
jgi:hypothetical protein